MTTTERLDKLKEMFKDIDFQSNKGISNQIGVYIFAYPPKDQIMVDSFVERLKKEKSFNIVEYDLFSFFLKKCEEKRIINQIPVLEEKKGSEFLLDQLSKIATPESFVQYMAEREYFNGDIILITGVGKVNPFMRVHAILEHSQNRFVNIPIVVMYPGKYDGQELHLFNKFNANHYRSFNLV